MTDSEYNAFVDENPICACPRCGKEVDQIETLNQCEVCGKINPKEELIGRWDNCEWDY